MLLLGHINKEIVNKKYPSVKPISFYFDVSRTNKIGNLYRTTVRELAVIVWIVNLQGVHTNRRTGGWVLSSLKINFFQAEKIIKPLFEIDEYSDRKGEGFEFLF